jgi:hypothetical protein
MSASDRPGEQPTGDLKLGVPSPARMYGYWLGGKDHFPCDRIAAREVEEHLPNVRTLMAENRAFMRRTVHYLAAECDIRQFIDFGSGLPTPDGGNVHEIAQAVDPDARVVYVDNDPVVLSHGRAILARDRTTVVTADVRDPYEIFSDPKVVELIDPAQPTALLLIAVLHFIPDADKPGDIVGKLLRWAAPGSYLVMSHVDRTDRVQSAAKIYDRATSGGYPRTAAELQAWFGGWEPVSPGLTYVSSWRPERADRPTQTVPWWGVVLRHPGEVDRPERCAVEP